MEFVYGCQATLAVPANSPDVEQVSVNAVQFVRKLSGFARPSKANEPAFEHAVEHVTEAARELLRSLVTNAPPRDREAEAAKARARAAERYGPPG